MADFRYFCDLGGQATELVHLGQMSNTEFAARWPGVRGLRLDGFSRRVGWAAGATLDPQVLPVTRMIEFKRWPSLHKCDARCLGGKVNGRCECQCGGKNHGAGMFSSLVAG